MADSLHNGLTNDATNGALHNLHLPGYSVANVAAMNAITTGSAGDLAFVQSSGSYYARSTGGVWQALGSGGANTDGWTPDSNIWLYASADAPTFVANVNADLTSTIGVGMRIKLNQTSNKYFMVTAVGAYSSGSTPITLNGGTDYTLTSANISSPYYSANKAPLGFPLDPAKWTISVTDTTAPGQNTPTQNTWYNPGGVTISIAIGAWYVTYQCAIQVNRSGAGTVSMETTLSTANNSQSDAAQTSHLIVTNTSNAGCAICRQSMITVASKTSFYLNARTVDASMASIGFNSNVSTTVISAVCAYL